MERVGNLNGRGGSSPKSSTAQPHSGGQQTGSQNTPGSNQAFPGASSWKSQFRHRRSGVKTDLTLIKGILAKALAGKGLDKKIDRYEFVLHWEKIVGSKLAEVSRPDYISRRTLIVNVLHPVWAQEFTFMKMSLLRNLAPYLKRGDIVEDMIFRVAPLEG